LASQFQTLSFPRSQQGFRKVGFPLDNTVFHLIVYADASSGAYVAVAYLRGQFKDKVTAASFVMAKGSLAPLKPTTIPRLALRAAILAVELSLFIKAELRIPITAVEYHSD
jgi:hypothetical protein